MTNNKLSKLRSSYIDYLQKEKSSLTDINEYFRKASKSSFPSNYLSEYQIYNSEYDREHTTYSNEQALLEAISTGNIEAYNEAAMYSLQNSLGQLSTNPLKSIEYQCVIGVSLFARAAIKGGVDSYVAYNLNDLYLQRISECQDVDYFIKVMEDAIYTFIDEVNKSKFKKTIPAYIEHAQQYIRNHISKPITIQDIADEVAISKEHLMRQFQKYSNCTISEYINKERIHAAKNMLIYSDYSIEQISSYLQYSSQSYFGKIFKELVGCTPNTFRKHNH